MTKEETQSPKKPKMLDSSSGGEISPETDFKERSVTQNIALKNTERETLLERHPNYFLEYCEYVNNEIKVIRKQEFDYEKKGSYELFLAAQKGDRIYLVTLLMGRANNYELTDSKGFNVLHYAVCGKINERDMLAIVHLVLNKFPHLITMQTKETKRSALFFACATGYSKVVKELLSKINDTDWLEFVDELGRTPLFYVSQGSDSEESGKIADMLLSREQNLRPEIRFKRFTDGYKQTALHTAVADGNVHVVRKLLSDALYQERIDDQDIDGLTALFFAYNSEALWNLLVIDHDADTKLKNKDGCVAVPPHKIRQEQHEKAKSQLKRAYSVPGTTIPQEKKAFKSAFIATHTQTEDIFNRSDDSLLNGNFASQTAQKVFTSVFS